MRTVPPGVLDARVLDQEQYWLTADAAVQQIAAMSTEHLTAVVAFLRSRATSLHMSAIVDALVDLIEADAEGRLTADQITHEVTGTHLGSVDAAAWLEATPLVRALRRELARRA